MLLSYVFLYVVDEVSLVPDAVALLFVPLRDRLRLLGSLSHPFLAELRRRLLVELPLARDRGVVFRLVVDLLDDDGVRVSGVSREHVAVVNVGEDVLGRAFERVAQPRPAAQVVQVHVVVVELLRRADPLGAAGDFAVDLGLELAALRIEVVLRVVVAVLEPLF